MLLPGHLASGYLVTYLFLKITNPQINQEEINFLLIFGMIISILPDLDLITFFSKIKSLKMVSDKSHRNSITHYPLLWLVAGLAIYFISSEVVVKYSGIVLILSLGSHYLFDSVDYGIAWLWPFSRKRYSILEAKKWDKNDHLKNESTKEFYKRTFRKYYFKSLTFYLEIIVIILSILVLILGQ